jgi:hypothetical protein
MKQKVIKAHSAHDLEYLLNNAIAMGWFVQSVTANEVQWLAVLIKDGE